MKLEMTERPGQSVKSVGEGMNFEKRDAVNEKGNADWSPRMLMDSSDQR